MQPPTSRPACDAHQIVSLMRAGDLQALDHLGRCYGQRLLEYGRRRCGEEQRAQDAVQDALLSAGEHLTDFRGEGSVEGWLVRMVAHACSRMRRGRKNDFRLHDDVADVPLATHVIESPEYATWRGQIASRLGDALMGLDPKDRAVVLLSDAEGFKGPEIATALGLSHDAVRTRLSRARKKLRGVLDGLHAEIDGVAGSTPG